MATDPTPLSVVVRFVNAWSPSARRAAVDDPDVRPDINEMLRPLRVPGPAPSKATLARLAEQLYGIFAAADSAARLAALNALVASARLRPVLGSEGLDWRISADTATLRSATVSALICHWTDDPSLGRLTVCAGHHCADALVDNTQANNRRYCSLTCQNRTKTRNRRRRLRDQKP
jgi:predicted RNA-binding Zn ribbon-like protein